MLKMFFFKCCQTTLKVYLTLILKNNFDLFNIWMIKFLSIRKVIISSYSYCQTSFKWFLKLFYKFFKTYILKKYIYFKLKLLFKIIIMWTLNLNCSHKSYNNHNTNK